MVLVEHELCKTDVRYIKSKYYVKKGTVHLEQVLFKKEVRYILSMHYLKEEYGAGGGGWVGYRI